MNNFDENKEFVRRPQKTSEEAPRQGVNRGTSGRIPPDRPSQAHAGANAPKIRTVQSREKRMPPSGQNLHRDAFPSSRGTEVRRPQYAQNNAQKKAYERTNTSQSRKKAEKSFNKRIFIKNIIIFAVMLAAMLTLGFILVLSSLYVAPERVKNSYTYVVNKEEIPSVNVNGVLCMNLTKLSDMCGFAVSGTKSCMRFTAYGKEYVEFTIGSRSAKINGDIINMEGAALIRENENVWIPLSFAEAYISGISITRNEEDMKISIDKIEIGVDDEENPIYENITFKVKGSQTLEGIDEDPDIGSAADLGFANDLSEYEKYMNPEDRDAYLILVNKTNTISADNVPDNLISIVNVRNDGRKEQLVETAEKALEALFIEMKSAGHTDVSVTSGYRSYNKQVSLFSTYLQREMSNNPSLSEAEAKEIVLTYSAFPGTSEHQTGLCCDMHNLSSADVAFAKKEAYTWLRDNCHKFGFILRFPEDKTEITGYSFEPWHYRFVGRYHATRMKSLGMCLEEYVEHLSRAENY